MWRVTCAERSRGCGERAPPNPLRSPRGWRVSSTSGERALIEPVELKPERQARVGACGSSISAVAYIDVGSEPHVSSAAVSDDAAQTFRMIRSAKKAGTFDSRAGVPKECPCDPRS